MRICGSWMKDKVFHQRESDFKLFPLVTRSALSFSRIDLKSQRQKCSGGQGKSANLSFPLSHNIRRALQSWYHKKHIVGGMSGGRRLALKSILMQRRGEEKGNVLNGISAKFDSFKTLIIIVDIHIALLLQKLHTTSFPHNLIPRVIETPCLQRSWLKPMLYSILVAPSSSSQANFRFIKFSICN